MLSALYAISQGGGGGGGYINGVVDTYNDLPVTVGTPAINTVYLVRFSTGVWLINRHPAGLYIRITNFGNLNDWEYLGTFPEVQSDSRWRVYNETDPTKEVALDVSGVTSGATRTLSVPNASGRIQVEGQPIGNVTPATGAFTTLTLADGTRLLPSFFFADDTDTGFFRRGVNTMTFVTNGTSRFEVSSSGPRIASADSLSWALNTDLTGSTDLSLFRDAADTLAQRRTTSAQTFNIYNTYTSATNHERGFLKWNASVFQIGTEKGSGGGTARALEFQTDGVVRMGISTGGTVGFGQQTGQSTALIGWSGNCFMRPINASAGVLTLLNAALDGFNRLQFGGTTSSFPALKRSSTVLQSRLADDSAFAPLEAASFSNYNTYTDASNYERGKFAWESNILRIGTEKLGTGTARALEFQTDGTTRMTIGATTGAVVCSAGLSVVTSVTFQGNSSMLGNIGSGVIRLLNAGSNGFDRLQFGGSTTSFPALKRNSTVLQSRLADDSDFAPLQGQLRIHQNAVSEMIVATHTLTLFDAAGTAYKVPCVAA